MNKKERYYRNAEAFSWLEMATIREKSVCVIGCGGLGGYVCHTLTRFGIGSLTLVDGDVFSENNLNRQLFATMQTLGQNKAMVTQQALTLINPDVEITAQPVMLTQENLMQILPGHHLAIDCLDSISSRITLVKGCAALDLPMIHGAIAGFHGQVATIFPGSALLDLLYPVISEGAGSLENKSGNPAFTPQLVAALQCSEALKFLAGRGNVRQNSVLYVDLLNNCFETVDYTSVLA